MTKEMTCIVCPIGCRMTVELADDNKILSVTGNTCPRGKKYAIGELTNPVRTLTSTVRIENDPRMLPVKTDKPIPKKEIFRAAALTRTVKAKLPIKCGDIICSDFIEQGTNLVACKDAE